MKVIFIGIVMCMLWGQSFGKEPWVFNGADDKSSLQSVLEFTEDEVGVGYIPHIILIDKIDGYECGNPFVKICLKTTLDVSDYSCLAKKLNGLTKAEIIIRAEQIPNFNCKARSWSNEPLKQGK